MNYSIQKLADAFLSRINTDDLKMLETVSPVEAFNYLFFLYKKVYGDYPTGELYKYLADKFIDKVAA